MINTQILTQHQIPLQMKIVPKTNPKTATAFYLNNHSGAHFDPMLTSYMW